MFMEAGDPMICYLQAGEPGKLVVVCRVSSRPGDEGSQWYKSQSES